MARRLLGVLAVLLISVGVVSVVPSLREQVSGWLPSSFATQTAKPTAQSKRNLRPVPVKVATAVRRTVAIHLEGVGTVKARSIVAVKSRIEGQLFDALVREGQTVRTGDILFRLDPRPLKARLKGKDPETAIYESCLLRFRPIMMTTFAALAGALPIALGHGAGAEARAPLGITSAAE